MSRPVPFPSSLSEPFWAACRRHELVAQRCERCGALLFYPRATCTSCGCTELSWRQVSGRGVLHSFTVARRATHRRLVDRVPYVIAVVQLEEGPRMTSTVVDCRDVDSLRIGQRLVVDFEDVDDQSVPVFRLDPED